MKTKLGASTSRQRTSWERSSTWSTSPWTPVIFINSRMLTTSRKREEMLKKCWKRTWSLWWTQRQTSLAGGSSKRILQKAICVQISLATATSESQMRLRKRNLRKFKILSFSLNQSDSKIWFNWKWSLDLVGTSKVLICQFSPQRWRWKKNF